MPTIQKTQKRPWIQERKSQEGRLIDNGKFYRSVVWRRIRQVKLTENPICEECERKGIITTAQVVDHIIQIIKGGEPLDLNNLQSLCRTCHNIKSAKESRAR